ncbi:hypothetical protein Ancab_038977 [Ancistrocladus abbreviatus]
MACKSFGHFVEEELGKFPYFVFYAVLEWILIALLVIDGLVAFIANEFAILFELRMPCLLCTRIDHFLMQRDPDYYYNNSICEDHKKGVSSLAYCHVHRKLSDIRSMCEGCLLSFSSETKPENKNLECLFDDELRARLKVPYWVRDEAMQGEKGNSNLCSCCGEPMKVKSSYQKAPSHVFTSNASRISLAPTPSPRAAFLPLKYEVESRALDLPHARFSELRSSDNSTPEDEESGNVPIADFKKEGHLISDPLSGKGDAKAPSTPLLMEKPLPLENEDLIEDTARTPAFAPNRFFGIPFTDSPSASPRFAHRAPRKSMLDKVELATDPVDMGGPNESEDSVLNRLKRQVRLDRKSLVALYMELDEERAASAIAANNAMAMITRLQAEKAAVQMEALQYQRMMEEQAEYDQEALQLMKDLLTKKEEEIRELEEELDIYRAKYGRIKGVMREDPLELRCESFSSFTERSDCGSPKSMFGTETDVDHEHEHVSSDKSGSSQGENAGKIDDGSLSIDFEHERSYLLGQLRMMESKLHTSADNSCDNGDMVEERGEGRDASLAEEVSQLGEKLRTLEADSGFLQQAFVTLEEGSEGSKLLAEIAFHLQKLRQIQTVRVDESSTDFELERPYLLDQLRTLESKLHTSTDHSGDKDNPKGDEADGSDASIAEEVSQLGEKLRTLEADSRFLQHAFLTLQKGGSEGSKLLTEIADHLQKLWHMQTVQLEPVVSVFPTSGSGFPVNLHQFCHLGALGLLALDLEKNFVDTTENNEQVPTNASLCRQHRLKGSVVDQFLQLPTKKID